MSNKITVFELEKDLFDRLKQFPPVLCRLLAKHNRSKPMTNSQIAERSGLSEMEVLTLSRSTSWDGVNVETMRLFTDACGLNLCDARAMKRVSVYLRGKKVDGLRVSPQFEYLRTSPDWKNFFQPLMRLYFEHLKQQKNKITYESK